MTWIKSFIRILDGMYACSMSQLRLSKSCSQWFLATTVKLCLLVGDKSQKPAVGCNHNRVRCWVVSDYHAPCVAMGLVQKNINQRPGSEFALILAMLKIGSLAKELRGESIYLITCYCHSFLFIPLGRH